MKLVLFEAAGQTGPMPGLLTERGVIDISGAVAKGYTPQLTMQGIIDNFDRLRPALEKLAAEGEARPLDTVRLRAPLPRPGKILCCIANYWEHAQQHRRHGAPGSRTGRVRLDDHDPQFRRPHRLRHQP